MRSKNCLIIVLLYFLSGGCSSTVFEEEEVVERVMAGDRVPLFTVDVVGDRGVEAFSTGELTGETVIVFFRTTCPDCQRELPELNAYYLRHRDDPGFRMVAISREEGLSTIASFWKEQGLLIPYSAQESRSVYELFASSVIPRVYFVSAQGIVTKVLVENFDLPE